VISGSLFDSFRAAAERRPQAPALTFLNARLEARCYTFSELFARAEEVAGGFDRFQSEGALGILMESQEGQVLHYLAALSRGWKPAILTPPSRKLDRRYYVETTRAVLEYCGFAAVVTDIAELGGVVTVLEPYTLQPRSPGPARRAAPPGGAFLQFSSGTTGIKRGVMVSDAAALAQIAAYGGAIGLSSEDCIASWLPLYHDMGFIACLNMPLACGVHTVMMQPLDWVADPGMYLRAVSRYRATLGWHPNFAFAFLAQRTDTKPRLDLSSLRGLVNCSEPVTFESQQRFLERFAASRLRPNVFWGCYAMAETTFALTHGTSSDPGYLDHRGPEGNSTRVTLPAVSVGRPLAGVELTVLDVSSASLADRTVGELGARSPFNFSGYYNNPDATAAAIRDGWYRTGDLGYSVGGEYFVCGRQKDVLMLAGVNIYPQDVEETVSRISGVLPGRAVAFAIFDESTQTERAVILAETAAPEDERAAITIAARQAVRAAFQISGFDLVLVPPGSLIKSSAGKIARNASRKRWLGAR
jgi:acyl-CoA synthetase (AMP-forming)/AMP-acid ligase II